MDPKLFYKFSYRRVTHATAMSEVRNLVKTIERPRSVILLTPAGGDKCDHASDNEEVPQDFETAFEPAGELKVKEHIDDAEKDQIDFLTTHFDLPSSSVKPTFKKASSYDRFAILSLKLSNKKGFKN